jgi:hypothetical protein
LFIIYIDNIPNHYWQYLQVDHMGDWVQNFVYCKLNYFPLPAIAPPIVAPSAALCSDTAGPASDPIAPPTIEPTVEPILLLSDAVPLSPHAMSVNTQQHS